MSFFKSLASGIPSLKHKLRSAAIPKNPEEYVKECFLNSLLMTFMLTILLVFILLKLEKNILFAFLFFIGVFFILYFLFLRRVDVVISRRETDIDKDVLFAGRFLLVKLNSGRPLINSIVDASNSYGVASKYFREIVEDIELGTPLEEALDNAYKNTPSKRFKRVLFQISNSLKIGVDVSSSLEALLEEISQEQLTEIQRYGKKLNSLTMFYMLLAVVLPSLGVTLFSVIASMVSINIDFKSFLIAIFFLIIVQLIFLSVFRSIRPNLNI